MIEINVGFKLRDVYNEVLPHNKHGYDNMHCKDLLSHLIANDRKRKGIVGLFDKPWSTNKSFYFISEMMNSGHTMPVLLEDFKHLMKLVKKSGIDNYLKGEIDNYILNLDWDKPKAKPEKKSIKKGRK